MSMNIKELQEDQDKMIKDIIELQRMIYRLNDYVYHIQKYLINTNEKGEDNED